VKRALVKIGIVSALAMLALGPAAAEEREMFKTRIEIKRGADLTTQCANGVVDQTDLAATLEICNAAVAAEPDKGDNYYYRAFNHFYLDDIAAAEADFTEAIERGTNHMAKAYYQRGVCKEQTRRLREASVDFKKAHELSPDWSQARRKVEEYAWAYK
jgi:tetratricopeptide (TPR) repeat protein